MSNASSGDFVSGLQDAVRHNPVSAALIGMGVLWMFTGGSKLTAAAALLSPAARATATGIGSGLQASANAASAAGDSLRNATSRVVDTVRDTVTDAAATLGNTASHAYEGARGAVTDQASGIEDGVRTGTGAATGFAGALQGNLKTTFERQPLLLGAIGLALGAGMAAAVPPTQLETQYAGDAAGNVIAQVKELASAQVDKVSEIAGRTLEAVKDEAAAQGLTAQGAKDAAAAVGDKLKTVAKRARNATT
jgi:hypothetical protein